MESNSDTDSPTASTNKNSLRLRFARVFSSGSLKSPKSPAASSSPGSSPGHSSPQRKSRYSWNSPLSIEEFPCSLKTGVSFSSSKSSVNSAVNSLTTSPSSQGSYFSKWYINEGEVT